MTSYIHSFKNHLENIPSDFRKLSFQKKLFIGIAITAICSYGTYKRSYQNDLKPSRFSLVKNTASPKIVINLTSRVSNIYSQLSYYFLHQTTHRPEVKEALILGSIYGVLRLLKEPRVEAIKVILPQVLSLLPSLFSNKEFTPESCLSPPLKTPKADSTYREKQINRVHFMLKHDEFIVTLKGEPGVGKSTLLSKIASDLQDSGITVYKLDLETLRNTERFYDSMSDRLDALNKFAAMKNATHPTFSESPRKTVFIVDEFATLHKPTEGGSSLANSLKLFYEKVGKYPAFQILGATTTDELDKLFENDSALTRRISVVELQCLSLDQIKEILLKTHGQEKKSDVEKVLSRLEACHYQLSARHSQADHLLNLPQWDSIENILDIYHPLKLD